MFEASPVELWQQRKPQKSGGVWFYDRCTVTFPVLCNPQGRDGVETHRRAVTHTHTQNNSDSSVCL